MEKLDVVKLKRDILKYESAGVPPEKMDFWQRVDVVFSKLDFEATLNDEVHLLNALLSKEHFTYTHDHVSAQVPVNITTALEKDQAPLPEVCKCMDRCVILLLHKLYP